MLKRTAILLMVIILLVAFVGCNTKDATTDKPTDAPKETTKATDNTTKDTMDNPEYINFMTPWELPQEILDKFKDETGIEVKQDVVPNSGQDYRQARNARMAAGSELDVIGADGADVPDFASNGTVVELTDEPWMSNFTPATLEKFSAISQSPGKQFWTVYEALTVGVWYNKDMFAEYNIEKPTTYDEFLAACDTLKANGITPLVQGGKDQWPLDQEFSMFMNPLQMYNVNFFPDLMSGKVKFTDPDIVKLAERLQILYPSNGYYVAGILSTSYDQAWQLMLQKKAAMWFMGSWGSEVMVKSNVEADFEIGAFGIPSSNAGQDGFTPHFLSRNFGVLATSEKIDAGKQFLGFMAQPDIAKSYADNGMTISTVDGVVSETMIAGDDWKAIFARTPVPEPNILDPNGKVYTTPEFGKQKLGLLALIAAGDLTTEEFCTELQKSIDLDIENWK